MQTINPANENVIETYEFLSDDQLEKALIKTVHAQKVWRTISVKDRLQFVSKLKSALHENFENLAEEMVKEMGKPIAQARAEVTKSQSLCDYYIENTEKLLGPRNITVPGVKKSYLSFQPKGVILGIIPWNFPLWQVMRFAVPTLLAGNGVLLKHAPNTFGCGELIGDVFSKLGLPEDLFQNIQVNVSQVKKLLADPQIRGVSFTGSTAGGKQVAALAGQYMKKSLFELGGSDPYLILDDADVEFAAKKLVSSRMLNAGQSCVAAKRFIALPQVLKAFTEAVVEEMKTYSLGDPRSEECRLGPLARRDLRDHLHLQVQNSVSSGAKLLIGGEISTEVGFYYPPTVLINVGPKQTAFHEELFGPVATILAANSEEQAIKWANATSYGLGGGVFSKDVKKAENLAKSRLDCGMVAVNDFVKSFPELPFGGEKDSGYGRELGAEGMLEFCNIKTILVQ